jgi:hypothetical protein
MPLDRDAEIARALMRAYRSVREQAPLSRSGSALVAEIVPIIAIYSEATNVHAKEIVSTDHVALVLTSETTVVAGEHRTWSGIHAWQFEAGHLSRFEAYAQTLVVIPPGTVAAD